MVLGSGHIVDDKIPPTSELSRSGLMRLAEGIRILRMYPGSKLILSGYAAGSEVSNARMMAKVALALGVAKPDIILLETAKDTWEEARQAAAFVNNKNLIVVTSASHMKRALNEFYSAGLNHIQHRPITLHRKISIRLGLNTHLRALIWNKLSYFGTKHWAEYGKTSETGPRAMRNRRYGNPLKAEYKKAAVFRGFFIFISLPQTCSLHHAR